MSERGRDGLLVGALLAVALVLGAPTLRAGFYFDDVEQQNLPERVWFGEGLRRGEIRWWCAEAGAGFPLFAEGQLGGAYPGNLLFAVLRPGWLAYSWSVLGHLVWAGLGVALLLRGYGCGRTAALAGGLVYALSGPVWFRAIHLNFLHGLAWLPWVFVGLERGVAGRGGWPLAGLALALQILAGHSHPPLLTLLAAPVYVVARSWPGRAAAGLTLLLITAGLGLLAVAAVKLGGWGWTMLPGLAGGWYWWRRAAAGAPALARGLRGLGGAVALAGLLAAAQALPLAELVPHTPRGEGLTAARALDISLTPGRLAGFLLPRLHGSPFSDDIGFKVRFDTAIHWEWAGHLGVLGLLLLWLTPWLGRRRERWLFWGLALGTGLLAMGQTFPFYRLLLHLPGWGSVRGPARLLGLVAFAGAVCVGLTLDELARRGLPERVRPGLSKLLPAVAALGCLAAALFGGQVAGVLEPAHRAAYTGAWLRAAAGLVAGTAVILTARAGSRRWRTLALAVLTIDLLTGSAGYHRLQPPDWFAPTAAVERAADPTARIRAEAYQHPALRANRHLLFAGVSNIALYSPLALRRLREIEDLLTPPLDEADVVARRWLAILRVKAVDSSLVGEPPGRLVELDLRRFPVAWVTPRWVRASSPAEALGLVGSRRWRPEAYTIVETPLPPAPRRGTVSEVLWSEVGRHRITCRVTGQSPGVLVLGQAWAPGWRVHREGSWRPAERVDYLLCGTPLTGGVARLDFVYTPLSLRLGLFVSLLGAGLLAGLLTAGRRP